MKLGEVLRKERENRGGGANRIEEVWTDMRPLSAREIEAIESGQNEEFERAAAIVAAYAKAFDVPVSQLYYPCGLPFQSIEDYEYRTA